jgi:hypothetical protein
MTASPTSPTFLRTDERAAAPGDAGLVRLSDDAGGGTWELFEGRRCDDEEEEDIDDDEQRNEKGARRF